MKYTLRPYQEKAVAGGVYHMREYASPFVIQAATGAGKSLMIAEICHRLNEPVLVLQPSKELLEQNYAKLESYGVEDIAVYSASKGRKEIGKYTYATIGSIYKKPDLFRHFKYVIIDECHGVNPKGWGMYKTFLTAIDCKHVCGLTATPYRVVQRYIDYTGEQYYTASLRMINRIYPFFFKKIIFKIETQDLIDQGYLAPIKYHTDETQLDDLVVNSTGADFTTESLESWGRQHWQRIVAVAEFSAAHAKRTLVFCTSIKQAQIACEAFRSRQTAANMPNGQLGKLSRSAIPRLSEIVGAAVVTGKTPAKEREEIVADFRSGKIKVLFNVGVFTTGFDVPELNSIILGRPTMSLALYYQMVGRGVRLDPEDATKELRVFDLAGLVERMGRVETVKLGKEPHGKIPDFYMDTIESEVGRMDEVPLFTFHVTKGRRA